MSKLDIAVYSLIAISYNIFIHHLTTMLYKDLPYEQKYSKSITFLVIAGLVGIIASRCILDEQAIYSESVVSMGLGIGGALLLATVVLINWENLDDIIKIGISGSIFVALLYYFYQRDQKKDKKFDK